RPLGRKLTPDVECGAAERGAMGTWRSYWRGSRCVGREDFAAAAAHFEQMLVTDPEHWAALMMLAYCYEALSRDKDALVASHRALKKEPGDFFALQVAGRVAARLGEHETARAMVTQALAVYPPPDPIPRQLSSLIRTVVNCPAFGGCFERTPQTSLI